MKKVKSFFKKYYPEVISMLIPIIVVIIASIFSELYPFGKYPTIKFDGYFQYPGFSSYFNQVLLGKESLFYSFKGLLGYNFYATAIYYLFNPSNILLILFNNDKIPEFYTILLYLRISMCAFTMCKYLKYKFKNNNSLFLVLFSVSYSLTAYNVCYYYNYMYFDVVVLLPLVMIGIEKLIHDNNILYYMITLTLTILSNFYIGYMVCVFSLIYFIYNYVLLEVKNKRIIKNFIISSLLCGLISSIILVPVVYELLQGKALLYQDTIQTNYFHFNMNFLYMFYKFTPGSLALFDIKYGHVNIYCTLFVIMFVIKYFFNKSISKKEKIVSLILIGFFTLSISFNLIDYFWHFMQRPIWYPNRYIFTFNFFLIMLGYKSFINNESIRMNNLCRIVVSLIFITLTIYPAFNSSNPEIMFKAISFTLSILLIFGYMIFGDLKIAKYLVLLLFFIEITLNTVFSFKTLGNQTTIGGYDITHEHSKSIVNEAKEHSKDDLFYRMELIKSDNYNSGAMYNYNGINIFDSLRNNRVMKFFDKYYGYQVSDSASVQFDYRNPYINSILGVKYYSDNFSDNYYEIVSKNDKSFTYNKDALGLGFMVNKNINNVKYNDYDYLNNLKNTINSMINKDEEIIKKLDIVKTHNVKVNNSSEFIEYTKDSSEDSSYILLKGVFDSDGFIMFNPKLSLYTNLEVKINGVNRYDYFSVSGKPFFVHKNDTYEFKLNIMRPVSESISNIYFINYDNYIDFINESKKNMLEIYEYEKDDNIKGKIVVNDSKSTLFTSIPYDKGWKVYVDNKKYDYKECLDTFICLDLPSGTHDIEFKFIPRGFIIGFIISFISVVISVIYIIKCKKCR